MSRLPQKILQGNTRLMPIEVLLRTSPIPISGDERQLLCWVLPAWQRAEVWSVERKKAFIEGIFLGLGTGTYVVHQPEWNNDGALPMSGWLVDGQQRLSAIRDFVKGGLTIFDGLRYVDLPEPERKIRFLSIVFPCIELAYQPDEQRLRELYHRLNFGGMPHTEGDLQHMLETPFLDSCVDVDRVAERFIDLLVKEIGIASFEEVVRRNASRSKPSPCHSHDFCNADLVMVVAWNDIAGCHFDNDSAAQRMSWSRAFTRAVEMMPERLEQIQAQSAGRDLPRNR